MNFTKISPEKFTWEKFVLQQGYSTTEFYNPLTNKLVDCELIGYCEAKSLRIRPRTEGIAVLVKDDENCVEVWFHLEKLPE